MLSDLYLRVDGMTCGKCEGRVRTAVLEVEGVESAAVSKAVGGVKVRVSGRLTRPEAEQYLERLQTAITANPKYTAFGVTDGSLVPMDFGPETAAPLVARVEGMTCNKCVGRVQTALRELSTVSDAFVSLSLRGALVQPAAGVDRLRLGADVLAAIASQNKEGQLVPFEDADYRSLRQLLHAEELASAPSVPAIPPPSSSVEGIPPYYGTSSSSGPPPLEAKVTAVPIADGRKVMLQIEGMTCSSCVGTVSRALEAVPGVRSATVNLLTSRAEVWVNAGPEHSVDDDALLLQAVTSAGGYRAQIVQESQAGEVALHIEGLDGSSDALRTLQHALMMCNGVDRVRIDGESQTAFIGFDPERTGVRDLIRAVAAAGPYKASLPSGDDKLKALTRNSELRFWRNRLIFSLVFAVPIMVIMVLDLFGLVDFLMKGVFGDRIPHITWMSVIGMVLATPTQFWVGYVFHRNAFFAMRARHATMDTLIVLGTDAAYFSSVFSVAITLFSVHAKPILYFDAAVMLITFIILGRYLENFAKSRTGDAIAALMSLQPPLATLMVRKRPSSPEYDDPQQPEDETQPRESSTKIILESHPSVDTLGGESEVCQKMKEAKEDSSKEEFSKEDSIPSFDPDFWEEEAMDSKWIQLGDVLKVLPGEKVPTDGTVVWGRSSVDQSMLTGESMPIGKEPGDAVYGGTMNEQGLLYVRATAVGDRTALSQIVRLVEEAQTRKAPIQGLADRISGVFVPVVIVLGGLTFFTWFALCLSGWIDDWMAAQDTNQYPKLLAAFYIALRFTVSVLVIACPCAMGLATPTAVMVGTGIGARMGVLIKGGAALEKARRIDAVIFDKTGTLTHGEPRFTKWERFSERWTEEQFFSLVGSAELGSEHPLGRALVAHARDVVQAPLATPTDFVALPGRGVRCTVGSTGVHVGTRSYLCSEGMRLEPAMEQVMEALEDMGNTCVLVALDGSVAGCIGLADTVKSEAASVVRYLRRLKIDVWMVTGDNRRTAAAIASELSILNVVSEVLPDEKGKKVLELQARGKKVAMVGDGVNDAVALTQADVGIALGAGTDVAIESADIVLMNSDLRDVITAIDLSRYTYMRIILNFLWAFGYNVVMIPLATGAFVAFHLYLQPVMAGAAMILSSLTVLSSSLLLRLYKRPVIVSADEMWNEFGISV